MDTKYLIVDNDGQCKEVEHVGEVGPDVTGTILADTFSVKAIRLNGR